MGNTASNKRSGNDPKRKLTPIVQQASAESLPDDPSQLTSVTTSSSSSSSSEAQNSNMPTRRQHSSTDAFMAAVDEARRKVTLRKPSRYSFDLSTLTPEEHRQIAKFYVEGVDGFSIQLINQDLSELPPWTVSFCDAKVIKEVNLLGNKLKDFPEELLEFSHLERLGVGMNSINAVPDWIGELRNLVWLDFTHNRISTVSDRIGELPRLASLGASDCRLTSFPISFTRLIKLRKLGIFNNLISTIPPEIGNMVYLTKLDLSGNKLATLPPEIGKLRHLNWLNVSNNLLDFLPPELGECTELRELGLAHNRLRWLPDLHKLRHLTLLTVFNNQLESLGEWIGELTSLSRLDLSSNQLSELPQSLLSLRHLTLLNVRQNRLMAIPPPHHYDCRRKPKSLAQVDLRDNQLVSLPITFLSAAIEDLKCHGNPWCRGRQLSTAAVIPSLEMLSLNAIVSERVEGRKKQLMSQIPLAHTLHLSECLRRETIYTCNQCYEHFMHLPLRLLEYRNSTDMVEVPFVVTVCSPTCREGYRSGAMVEGGRKRSSIDSRLGSPIMLPPPSQSSRGSPLHDLAQPWNQRSLQR